MSSQDHTYLRKATLARLNQAVAQVQRTDQTVAVSQRYATNTPPRPEQLEWEAKCLPVSFSCLVTMLDFLHGQSLDDWEPRWTYIRKKNTGTDVLV